ncbi:30S ribosomal protein S8 [Candidatus Trichorickettsia mobilis]|jgi:small subunit ribosomal protein S8|uniref:30S ribosomal protein S8 n=1 Tax=Candidatus Trichorickettsia mobilis TaxID=1346319 RepID=UPI00292E723D|nr:30S ribosomal protein S8 [Candidatus Trichorickettsia mobilis]
MSMTDTIADMLTRIRNGQKARLINISLPCSKIKCAILDVLVAEGYVKGYEVSTNDNIGCIEVELKYSSSGKPVISEIHRVSKPGKRVYSSIDKLKGYYNNMGIYILSTSKGVISDREAHHLKIGGEIVCKVF